MKIVQVLKCNARQQKRTFQLRGLSAKIYIIIFSILCIYSISLLIKNANVCKIQYLAISFRISAVDNHLT